MANPLGSGTLGSSGSILGGSGSILGGSGSILGKGKEEESEPTSFLGTASQLTHPPSQLGTGAPPASALAVDTIAANKLLREGTAGMMMDTMRAANQLTTGQRSDQMLGAHVEEGALSVADSRTLLARADAILDSSTSLMAATSDQVNESIQTFKTEIDETTKRLGIYAGQIANKAINGEALDANVKVIFAFLADMSKRVREEFEGNQRLYMEFQKANLDGTLDSVKNHVDTLFYSRMEALKAIREQLNLAHKQENHELGSQLQAMDKQLEAEHQVFKQIMESARLDREGVQADHERQLAMREQIRKENKDASNAFQADRKLLVDAELEDRKQEREQATTTRQAELEAETKNQQAELENQTAQAKIEAEKAIEQNRIDSTKEVEQQKLASQERIAYAQTTADLVKLAKPKCAIQ